jgi:hypothetical protein
MAKSTSQKFRENNDLVNSLKEFLSSPTGVALMVVLEDSNPAKALSRGKLDPTMARQSAIAESGDGTSQNLLGIVEGYGAAVSLIKECSERPTSKSAASKKAGGTPVPPATPPRS